LRLRYSGEMSDMPIADRWHYEVPGTRWFRADLHLHTLDDPYVALPDWVAGAREDAATRAAYAARFLDVRPVDRKGALPRGVQRPHGRKAGL